jgi:hypothetical protein
VQEQELFIFHIEHFLPRVLRCPLHIFVSTLIITIFRVSLKYRQFLFKMKKQMNHSPIESYSRSRSHAFATVADTNRTVEKQLGKLEYAQAQALSFVLEEEGSSSNVASLSDLKKKQERVYYDSSVGRSETRPTARSRFATVEDTDRSVEQHPGKLENAQAQALSYVLEEEGSSSNVASLSDLKEKQERVYYDSSVGKSDTNRTPRRREQELSNSPIARQQNPALQAGRDFAVALALMPFDSISGENLPSLIKASTEEDEKDYEIITNAHKLPPHEIASNGKKDDKFIKNVQTLPSTPSTFQRGITLEMLEKDAESGKLQSRTQNARFDATGDVLVSENSVRSRGGTSSAACVRRMPANLRLLGKGNPPMVDSCSSSLPMRSPNITATGRSTNRVRFEEPASTASDRVTRATDTTTTTEDPERPKEPTHESEGEEVEEKESRNVRFKLLLGTLLVVAAGLIVGLVLVIVEKPKEVHPDPSESTPINETAVPISKLDTDTVLAVVPETICMDQVPGGGWSKLCTAEDTMENGGGACDLVAQAFLDQVPMADVAIQNSASCLSDISKGKFTIKDAMELLPKTHTLLTLEITGQAVVLLLEQAINGVLGESVFFGSYPYSAGLRYRVNATAKYMHRVTDVEVNERLDQTYWRSIELDEVYTVVANSYIASGGDDYVVFEHVPEERVTNTGKDATETFVEYALEQTILLVPREDEYSTQEFIPWV